MEVQLIDSMGTDLTVVNAARVSYAKQSELVWEEEDKALGIHKQTISERDQKLIKFLDIKLVWIRLHPSQYQLLLEV